MFVTFDVVKHKNRAIARRQILSTAFCNCSRSIEPASARSSAPKSFFGVSSSPPLRGLFQRNHRKALLSQVHEHHVHRQAMKPCRECRLTAKRSNLPVELQERFLGQVLSLGRVRGHSQAQRIYSPLMLLIKGLERSGVALLGFLDQLGFV